MKTIKMLSSMAGPDISLPAGQLVSVDDLIAAAWVAAGSAAEVTKREVSAGDVVEYKPAPARMAPPPGLPDPLTLPDGKQRALADVVASVARRNELDMAAWNNLGQGQKRELIDREFAEMRRKVKEARRAAPEAAALVPERA